MSELRQPPATGPKIASGNEIDWAMAERAAKMILKQCEDAHFCPPEAVDIHQMRIGYICNAMNALADALRLRRGGTP